MYLKVLASLLTDLSGSFNVFRTFQCISSFLSRSHWRLCIKVQKLVGRLWNTPSLYQKIICATWSIQTYMFTFNHLYIYILHLITCNCAAWRCWKSSAWLLYTLVGHMGSYMGAAQITWRGLPIGDWWELKVATLSLGTSSPTAPHPPNLFLSRSLSDLISFCSQKYDVPYLNFPGDFFAKPWITFQISWHGIG